jgi:phenylalanyl-tRNA synthetase beta chain
MKISLTFLKKYIDIDDISPADISHILTLAGIEVENIENESPSFSHVISAIIEEVAPHPKADKLKLATIFDGRERFQVVCGAPNCRKGLKTAFAPIGATLTMENKKSQIKKCKIKEVDSFGMLCSQKELKVGANSSEIIELADDIPLGIDLSKVLIDPVFDISLTPNLGHCLSAIGIARELAALTSKKVKYPDISFEEVKEISTHKNLDVEIVDKTSCLRYSALYIENVEIAPSPSWLKKILESSSIRPINNIVDIMNFVMLETGQPLHSFDFDKLEKQKISILSLKKEEKFLGLDGLERILPKNSLVIKDSEKTVAIAGILGGENSAVGDSTKNLIIESALFHPLSIRKASHALSLRTESSLRFEKGIDPNGTLFALKRCAHLIKLVSPSCRIGSDFIDMKEKEFRKLKVSCRLSRTNKILGTKLSLNEAENLLNRLEMDTKKSSEDLIEVEVPTYRNDVKTEIDLIEEIARIFGYNNLEKKSPRFTSSSTLNAPLYTFETSMKKLLIAQGLQEFITSDLISPKLSKMVEEKSLPKSALIEVLHAKSEEHSQLRSSFLPSFLQVIKHNHDHKNFNIHAFEIGKVHFKKDGELVEQPTVALVLSGKNRSHHWKEKPRDVDFYDLKGIVENIFEKLKIKDWSVQKSSHPSFHPGRQANIFIGDTHIGVMGEIHPSLLSEMDIKRNVLIAELNNYFLMKYQKLLIKYLELPEYPSSERDWTITIGESVNIASILKKISSNILEELFILDVYQDPKLSSDQKNVTLRFVYRDKNKTISFEEVENEHQKIINEITKELKNLEPSDRN